VKLSNYVSGRIENDFERENFFEWRQEFADNLKAKSLKSSLKIMRLRGEMCD
jgi:hypothetical protein